MIRQLTGLLDRTTMYRLLVVYLGTLVLAAFGLGFFKLVPAEPTALAFSLVVVLGVAEVVNWVFARTFAVPPNRESSLITGLLVVLLMAPVTAADLPGVGGLAAAAVWAIASKYMIRLRGRHVFNPAAFGVALTGLVLVQPATWWVTASVYLLPVIVAGGICIVIKVRRADMVLAAIAAYVAGAILTAPPGTSLDALLLSLAQTSILFLCFAMLTEPLTAPQGRWPGIAFGLVVGGLATPGLTIGPVYFTPEIALLLGNLLALVLAPRDRLVLTLKAVEEVASNSFDFVFSPSRRLRFRPGQYLEWTLGVRDPDGRGNRRYFTIASAPGEADMRLGVKFYPEPSAFKRSLKAMQPGDKVYAAQLAGHFVMPRDKRRKLAFLAGGIGITPFRSMVKHMLDQGEAHDAVLLYGCGRAGEFAYRDIFETAREQTGLKPVYAAQFEAAPPAGIQSGIIDEALIRREMPDWKERLFYVSGPPPMVRAVRKTLRGMGVLPWRIRTDFFPGLSA